MIILVQQESGLTVQRQCTWFFLEGTISDALSIGESKSAEIIDILGFLHDVMSGIVLCVQMLLLVMGHGIEVLFFPMMQARL